MINEQETQQKLLQTKSIKLQKELDKTTKLLADTQLARPKVESIQQQAGGGTKSQNGNDKDMSDIQKLLGGTLLSQTVGGDSGKPGAKKTAPIILCQCGARDPQYRGYCKECLMKLKGTFDAYLKKFTDVSDEYDSFTGKDQKVAVDKLRLMKNKIEQYEIKLGENQLIDVLEKHEKLSQTDENRGFAEFRASVEAMKQELAIMKTRHAIELEDLRKQADTLESIKIRKVSKQNDIQNEAKSIMDEHQQLMLELEEIDKRMVLKKRYVMYHTEKAEEAGMGAMFKSLP